MAKVISLLRLLSEVAERHAVWRLLVQEYCILGPQPACVLFHLPSRTELSSPALCVKYTVTTAKALSLTQVLVCIHGNMSTRLRAQVSVMLLSR